MTAASKWSSVPLGTVRPNAAEQCVILGGNEETIWSVWRAFLDESNSEFLIKARWMLRIAVLILTCIGTISKGYSDIIGHPYVSPGIKLGFGKAGGFSISPKISLGIHTSQTEFVNITYGRLFSFGSPVQQKWTGYRYLELEGGMPVGNWFLVGGGAGLCFPVDSHVKFMPKFSFFAGAIVFVRIDTIVYSQLKSLFVSDYGVMIVAPVSPVFLYWD